MVALMPARKSKTTGTKKERPEGTRDFFTRVDEDLADKFDTLVNDMTPATSRSAVLAMLVQRFVAAQWPEYENRNAGEKR